MRVLVAAAAFTLATAAIASAQQVLKNEPPQGGMRSGETVLVDNGKCPKGQVLRVTAGVVIGRGQAGSSGQGTPREKTCVPRS